MSGIAAGSSADPVQATAVTARAAVARAVKRALRFTCGPPSVVVSTRPPLEGGGRGVFAHLGGKARRAVSHADPAPVAEPSRGDTGRERTPPGRGLGHCPRERPLRRGLGTGAPEMKPLPRSG